jgi:hypothetical protein
MSWFNKVLEYFGYETVRARDEKGRYVGDDKSTPDVNEAYTVQKVKKPRKSKKSIS